MMETLYINQLQCQVVIEDPEKTQDPAGIRTQDLLITSHTCTVGISMGTDCAPLLANLFLNSGT